MTDYHVLNADDLIPNEPLAAGANAQISDEDDWFRHRHIARRVAQLIATPGTNVNIAVNAPWGAGKSSFFALLKEELRKFQGADGKDTFNTVDFDAWQMADDTFESNFLATVADGVADAPKNIEQELFKANRTVSLPFGVDFTESKHAKKWVVAGIIVAVLLMGWITVTQTFSDPAVSAALGKDDWGPFIPTLISKLFGVLSATAGGTVLVVIVTTLLNLRKVTVHESGPAHVTQFRKLFKKILVKTTATQVILVDELDRCSPDAVMRTLEGLRRFLGAERCVFVVAFDRESVVETITEKLERKIPSRPGRPYYSTAGEYLDKIFTYQVALPPQPRKAFRKYAKQLVEAKGNVGVWGELSASHPERLDRVLAILSPPHLTSPRRTKVLLNDFAINARMVEAYDGAWVERADEIAVLTVLQTEFPLFYADVEHYPNLLIHVAGRAPGEPSESLSGLVQRYRNNEAAVETVVSDKDDVSRIVLGNQLKRYLEKLRDMQVILPRADLVQLGAGKQMLEFEDPSVFAIVEAATEVPRDETLTALRSASAEDQLRAVEVMLADSEGESSAEAMTLRVIAGTLIPELDDAKRAALMPRIDSAWSRVAGSAAITQLTEPALRGFASALGPTKPTSWALHILRATYNNVDLHAPAVHIITEHATDEAVTGSRATLLKHAIDLLPEQRTPLLAALRRLDAAAAPAFDASFTRILTEILDTDVVMENDEPGLQAVADLNRELHELIDSLPPRSNIRQWLVSIFRARAIASDAAASDYLSILNSAGAAEDHRAVTAEEILRTLALPGPDSLQLRLAALPFHANDAPATELVAPALRSILRLIADDTADELEDLLPAVKTLSPLGAADPELAPGKIVPLIESAFTGSATMTRARYDLLLSVAHTLSHVDALTDSMTPLISTLAVTNVVGVPDGSDRVHVLQGLRSESTAVLRQVADELRDELPGANGRRKWIVDATLCAHHHLHSSGQPVAPLSAELVQPFFAQNVEPEALHRWVETGPPASDINTVMGATPLRSAPASSWELYAARTSIDNRTTLWTDGVDSRERRMKLSAVASRGIEQAARVRAANRLALAPNTPRRLKALDYFSTLPTDEGTAIAILPVLRALLTTGLQGEARAVFGLLIEHQLGFDKAAMTELKVLIPTWYKKVHLKLRTGSRESLVAAGYMRRERPTGRRGER